VHSSHSRKKEKFGEALEEDQDYHHLSIPEISNVNLYNQKPFLKKNSINTTQEKNNAHDTPQKKKHFEYGTPLSNGSNTDFTPTHPHPHQPFEKEPTPRNMEKNHSNKKLLTTYELNKLENKYGYFRPEEELVKPISQFHAQDKKVHQSLLNNRVEHKHPRKNSIGSKRRPKNRSKSKSKRKNWSKQRIRRELEKFEEELQEEVQRQGKEQKEEGDDIYLSKAMPIRSKMGRLGQRKSKRASLKQIHKHPQKANSFIEPVKASSRLNSSRNSQKLKKQHLRKISNNLEDHQRNFGTSQMTRSHLRQIQTARHQQHEMSLPLHSQNFEHPMDSDHPHFAQRRRKVVGRYLQSSRDIQPQMNPKHIRQSYEHNYVPGPRDHHSSNWEDAHARQRIPGQLPPNYQPHSKRNPQMNFDYRNLNANVHMKLPFE
jgi:hypothetical protein